MNNKMVSELVDNITNRIKEEAKMQDADLVFVVFIADPAVGSGDMRFYGELDALLALTSRAQKALYDQIGLHEEVETALTPDEEAYSRSDLLRACMKDSDEKRKIFCERIKELERKQNAIIIGLLSLGESIDYPPADPDMEAHPEDDNGRDLEHFERDLGYDTPPAEVDNIEYYEGDGIAIIRGKPSAEEPECPAGVEYDDDPACCDCSEDNCPNEASDEDPDQEAVE